MATLNELRSKAAELIGKQEEILARPHPDGEATLTAEESAEFDRIEDELRGLETQIERLERHEGRRDKLSRPVGEPIKPEGANSSDPAERQAAYAGAFDRWLRFGHEGMEPEERALLRTGIPTDPETRAQTVTTTGGGYLIPQGFMDELMQALKAFGGVRAVARILATPTGNPLPWPTVDDTGNVGELLAINTAAAALDFTFGQTTLNAYKWSSKVVLVPIELAQDSAFDLDAFLNDALATRIGRAQNTYYTTGTGTAQPQGIVVASSVGFTAGAATAVSYDDLVELEHSVDPLYRRTGKAGFMFRDSTLKAIKKLKDVEGRPLWSAGFAEGVPSTILGYPYTINQDVAAIATTAKSVLFGDFSHYVIRDVLDVMLLRLVERYAEFAQIGYIAFARSDGRGVGAESTFAPFKHLLHP